MKKNKVSVLMTVYNTDKYIKDSINSVLSQTYKNFELIIVDDGSNDNSKQIIKKFKNKKIKKYLLKKNIGRIRALNYALRKSAGRYIAILDSDDISIKKRLKTQVDILNKDKNLMLIGSMVRFNNENGKKLFTYPSLEDCSNFENVIHYKNVIPFSTVIFRKEIIKSVGEFSTKVNYAIDYDFILRVKRKYKIRLLPKILVKYTLRAESLTNQKKLAPDRCLDQINNLKYSNKNFRLSSKLKAIIYLKIAIQYLKYISFLILLNNNL